MKTINATPSNPVRGLVPDVEFWGDGDTWKLISKAWSKREGWMKSTKALETGNGCLVQVTTQQGNEIAEAVTFVPDVVIKEITDEEGNVTGRSLVPFYLNLDTKSLQEILKLEIEESDETSETN